MIDQAFYRSRKCLEVVGEVRVRRRVGLAEADIVRRDHVEAIRPKAGIKSRNICELAGKPCNSSTVGAAASPASR